jgi:hypothetical protein
MVIRAYIRVRDGNLRVRDGNLVEVGETTRRP